MKRILTNKDLIKSASGVITKMAPGMKPRNLQAIVDYIDKYFREEFKNRDDSYCVDNLVILDIEEDEIYDFVDKLLKGCKEFNDLNLSQDEIDRGITVDDPSRLERITSKEPYLPLPKFYIHDFIDLDACIRNINKDLHLKFLDEDLFGDRCKIIDIEIKKYKIGEPVIYIDGNHFELGIIEGEYGDDIYLVTYRNNETAKMIHAKNLHKIENQYAFHVIPIFDECEAKK